MAAVAVSKAVAMGSVCASLLRDPATTTNSEIVGVAPDSSSDVSV